MTKGEKRRMQRLEAENIELRAAIARHLKVYRDQVEELIFLRAKRDMLNQIATELCNEAAYWPEEFERRT